MSHLDLLSWLLVIDSSDLVIFRLLVVVIDVDINMMYGLAGRGSCLACSAAAAANDAANDKEDNAKNDTDDHSNDAGNVALLFSAADSVDSAVEGALVGWDHSVGGLSINACHLAKGHTSVGH